MLNNPMVDLATGLAAFFLGAALMVTTLQEAIAQLLDLRARTLRAAIGKMLDGDMKGGANTAAFFEHPLIQSLNTRKPEIGPSYIPRAIFLEVVRDIATAQGTAKGFLDAAVALPDGGAPLQAILKGLAANATDAAGALDNAVGEWFDAGMERISGLYKRNAQALAFWLGLMVAAAANLNAVAVGSYLATNSAARTALAEATVVALKARPEFDPANKESREKLRAALTGAGAWEALPIGWTKPPKDADLPQAARHYFWMILYEGLTAGALLGWLVTALATTLGAAFWFDLLKRFVNIRAAGPRPEDTQPARA